MKTKIDPQLFYTVEYSPPVYGVHGIKIDDIKLNGHSIIHFLDDDQVEDIRLQIISKHESCGVIDIEYLTVVK